MTTMRRILALGVFFALTVSVGAQETTAVQAISTPFMAPNFAISPDRTMLAVFENPVIASNEVLPDVNLPILLIDTATGEETGRLEGAQVDLTRSAAFSPDSAQLASYHINGDLIIWDLATREAVQVYDWLPMGGGVIEYLPDGQSLAIVANSGLMGQHVLFDLTSGSITDILSVRPDTFAQLNEQASDTLSMGVYSVAAQAVGPSGELYGATGNGDVYRWDTEARLRELLYPASGERPLRFNVRSLQVLDDGTLAFLDNDTGTLVVFDPDGIRADYPLTGQKFALSEDGFAAAADTREDGLFVIDLNAASPEAEQISLDLGTDAEGEPVELRGDLLLAFAADGDLVIGGVLGRGDEGAVYIVDLP
jgi:WD40 repeat protein